MTARSALFLVAACFGLAFLPSCQTVESPSNPFTFDLGNAYVSTSERLTWIGPKTERPFGGIYLDPLQVRFHRRIGVNFAAMSLYASIYEGLMSEHLEPDYPLARSKKKGTLRVSAVLTDHVAVDELHRNSTMRHLGPSGNLDRVGLEVQFRDAHTGDLLAAMISTEYAHLYRNNLLEPNGESMRTSLEWFASMLHTALDRRTGR